MNFNRQIQSGVGIMVAIACVCLGVVLVFGTKNMGFLNHQQNTYYAQFDEIGGLYLKAPVRIAGVNIGLVKNITLNPKNYRAVVELAVNQDIPIPVDSIIKIYTEGVLGAKYLAITPGYDDKLMDNKSTFTQAESAVILEGLISQFINTFVVEK